MKLNTQITLTLGQLKRLINESKASKRIPRRIPRRIIKESDDVTVEIEVHMDIGRRITKQDVIDVLREAGLNNAVKIEVASLGSLAGENPSVYLTGPENVISKYLEENGYKEIF